MWLMLSFHGMRGVGWLVVAAILSGLLGWAVARKSQLSAATSEGGEPLAVRSSQTGERAHLTAGEFREWVDRQLAEGPGRKERMAAWDEKELRSALEAGMKDPELTLNGPAIATLQMLLEEWTSRDPEAAAEWWQSIPSQMTRARMATAISSGWPRERAAEGLDFVAQHRDAFLGPDGSKCGDIIGNAMTDALGKGPEMADEFLARLREEKLPLMSGNTGFPPGFDFPAFSRAPEMSRLIAENRARFFNQAWLKQDPETAFAAMIELHRSTGVDPKESIFAGFYPGLRTDKPDLPENAGRLGKLIATLDSDEQLDMAMKGAEIMGCEPAAVEAFVESLTDPLAKARASVASAKHAMGEDVGTAMRLFAAEGDSEQRLELVQAALEYRRDDVGRPISAADEQALRNALAGWAVAPERIDELAALAKKKGGHQ